MADRAEINKVVKRHKLILEHYRAYQDVLETHYRGLKIAISAKTGEFRIECSAQEMALFLKSLPAGDGIIEGTVGGKFWLC